MIGGDTNNSRRLRDLVEDFPDLDLVGAPPTRGTAKLDEFACNFQSDRYNKLHNDKPIRIRPRHTQ